MSKTRTMSMLACLSALMAVSRIALVAGPPNVKPTAFLAIFSGIVGGPMFGLVAGSLGMFVSDLYIGAGPWTLVTAGCMGLIGFLGGFVVFPTSRLRLFIFGFVVTMIYDIGTSLIFAVLYGYSWIVSILGLYLPFAGSPYPFGLVHELTTALLFVSIGPHLIKTVIGLMEMRGRRAHSAV